MDLQVIEHKNERVLTTSQLSDSFGTNAKIINRNFQRNSERYKVGKHYFSLTGEELKEFKATRQIDDNLKFASVLYLWTEKGAWLHAKSLNTDRAWDAYEMLVDDYYRVKELQQPKSSAEMLLMYAEQFVKQEKELRRIKSEHETIKHRLDNIDKVDTIGDLQQRLNAMVRRYAQDKGVAFGIAWRDFRQAYNTAYRTNLKNRMNHYKDKHKLKSLTMPQYLSLTDSLPDAIRVADKMLNKELV